MRHRRRYDGIDLPVGSDLDEAQCRVSILLHLSPSVHRMLLETRVPIVPDTALDDRVVQALVGAGVPLGLVDELALCRRPLVKMEAPEGWSDQVDLLLSIVGIASLPSLPRHTPGYDTRVPIHEHASVEVFPDWDQVLGVRR